MANTSSPVESEPISIGVTAASFSALISGLTVDGVDIESPDLLNILLATKMYDKSKTPQQLLLRQIKLFCKSLKPPTVDTIFSLYSELHVTLLDYLRSQPQTQKVFSAVQIFAEPIRTLDEIIWRITNIIDGIAKALNIRVLKFNPSPAMAPVNVSSRIFKLSQFRTWIHNSLKFFNLPEDRRQYFATWTKQLQLNFPCWRYQLTDRWMPKARNADMTITVFRSVFYDPIVLEKVQPIYHRLNMTGNNLKSKPIFDFMTVPCTYTLFTIYPRKISATVPSITTSSKKKKKKAAETIDII